MCCDTPPSRSPAGGLTVGRREPETNASTKDAAKPIFALLTSAMHMAWLRHIGARLKSDLAPGVHTEASNTPAAMRPAMTTPPRRASCNWRLPSGSLSPR